MNGIRQPIPQLMYRSQGGAVLVVALIFLLLVTLIGVSSMQNATMQEKMAGSVMLKNRSFQTAEAALRLGENEVQATNYNQPKCVNAVVCAPPAEATSTTLAAGKGASGVVWKAVVNNTGFYGVQFLGVRGDVVNVPANKCPNPNSIKLFRVTGVGVAGLSRTVVESMYVKC
jgi:type IV pilus assembly protein PilX